jgi:hypothetical protein
LAGATSTGSSSGPAYRRRFYPDCDPAIYAMFDLLVDRGETLMGMPLIERKARLKKRFAPKPKHDLLVVEAGAAARQQGRPGLHAWGADHRLEEDQGAGAGSAGALQEAVKGHRRGRRFTGNEAFH